MAVLQVRDLPMDLYNGLKARADAEHRSLAQQTIVAIEAYLNFFSGSFDSRSLDLNHFDTCNSDKLLLRRKEIFDELDKLSILKIPDDFPSVVEIIEEGRERCDDCPGL